MEVLILHQHFKSPIEGGAIRSYYLAKALTDAGIRVSVVTGFNGGKYRFELIDGIEVHCLPVSYENRFGFLRRTISFLMFVLSVIRRFHRFKNADLVYAISTPLTTGLAALWINRKYGTPFIFEVGDLWPEAPVQMGAIKNRTLKNLLISLERKIYSKARSVVALSTSIKTNIERKAEGKVVHVLPNMSDTCFYLASAKNPALEIKFRVKDKFVVSYTGAVGAANGLEYFLFCANASQRAGLPIQFLLCGDGAFTRKMKHLAENLGLKNLNFIPFQNREGVRDVMNITDAVFVCYKPVPVLETGSPNKYFDGLSAGKLIIINFGGWIKEEIERNKCGIYLDPSRPDEFVERIGPFLTDRKMMEEYQGAARSLAERSYSRKMLSERFVSIVSENFSR